MPDERPVPATGDVASDDDVDSDVDDPDSPGTPSAETADTTGGDRHTVVLPWWQRPINIATLLVTTALIAAMIGWLVHDTVNESAGSDTDVGFLWDMRLHHEQAVQMGFIYLDLEDTEPRMREIAAEIVMGQNIEIGLMIQMLRDFDEPEARDLEEPTMGWMGMVADSSAMPGMATQAQLEALQQSEGREADELFADLMVVHHQGGISMATYAADNGDDERVTRMAASMASSQYAEIVQMRRLIEEF